MTSPVYIYRGLVERVIDGDTLVVRIDLGLRVHTVQHLRVRGIDAPELSTEAGQIAKALVTQFFLLKPHILVQTYKDQQSFSRWIADVYLSDGTLFTDWLRPQLGPLSPTLGAVR